jgi:flagellar biosynthesis protein FlhG
MKQSTPGSQTARRIIAVGSGKGGVGASMITTNLAIFMGQIGKRVALIDANLASPGLHAWLGADRPARTIGDLLYERVDNIEDALVETRVAGLFLLAGVSDLMSGTSLDEKRINRFIAAIRSLETDYVLVDLPSGMNPLAINLLSRADLSIIVTVGTPDSVEATFRLMAAVFLHRLLQHPQADPVTREVLEEMGCRAGLPPHPREIVTRLTELESPLSEAAQELSTTFHPNLIVNQTRIKADEYLGEAMVSASVRWIGLMPRLLGSVGWDDNVWLALRRNLPLLIEFPRSRACKDLERIVRKMLSQEFKDLFSATIIPPVTEDQNLYELLEIYPGASEEEVRRALKQIKEWFGPDGLAGQGSCTVAQREDYQRRAEEAHAKLLDRSKRRQYDRSNFPDGFAAAREHRDQERTSIAGTVAATHDSLPEVVLSDDQFVDGVFMGEVRRERNVELTDISNRAKISISYLKAIEEERFEDLPAAVFVRGFVTEFARFLKINPRRAVTDFMAKYEAFAHKKVK